MENDTVVVPDETFKKMGYLSHDEFRQLSPEEQHLYVLNLKQYDLYLKRSNNVK